MTVIALKKRKELAREAMMKAARIRSQTLEVDMLAPIDVYRAADDLGVRVMFKDYKSVEGVYHRGNPSTILLTSLRPSGRQAFTCGHELGHHVFGHGDKLGEVINWRSNEEEEFLVNCFSGYLMMPPSVVNYAFTTRGWNPKKPTPKQAFIVAGVVGSGYTSLLNHMALALNILNYQTSQELQRISPKDIREEILGAPVEENVFVIDEHWPAKHRSVDAEVDDYILVPHGTIADTRVVKHIETDERGEIYRSVQPGTGRFMNSRLNWAAYVRVSRRNFTGWARYRYSEDAEFEHE